VPRKALITGASGFIARHLAPALVALGCEPVLLSRAPERERGGDGGGPRWLETDPKDASRLEAILRDEAPDVVFHLAGTRGRGARSPFLTCAEANLCDTLRLLEGARHAAPAARVLLAGSAEEYGDQPGAQVETLPLQPTTPYGLSKAAATRFAQAMHAQAGSPVVTLRLFTVYGPGQPRDMFVAEAVDCAVRDLPFRMSRGEQRRDLVFVRDVVDALVAAASAPGIDGTVINVGSGQAHRLRDVAHRIWELSDSRAPLLVGAREAGPSECADTWADVARARDLLGWQPRFTLERGLEETIRWAREQASADPAR
jgi:nucleoside-diphosphate-sugar epimerase